jgi:hypothetical protein
MTHLTNDAVQKKGEEYGKFESGNKVRADYDSLGFICGVLKILGLKL